MMSRGVEHTNRLSVLDEYEQVLQGSKVPKGMAEYWLNGTQLFWYTRRVGVVSIDWDERGELRLLSETFPEYIFILSRVDDSLADFSGDACIWYAKDGLVHRSRLSIEVDNPPIGPILTS